MRRRLSLLLFLPLLIIAFGGRPELARGADKPATAGSATPLPNLLSIVPAQGEPGMNVQLHGSGFATGIRVILGATVVTPSLETPQQLTFEIPPLEPGLYALYLRLADGTASRAYSFTVTAPRPVAERLVPDSVSLCNDSEVTVQGHNLLPGSQLLFDGAVIRSRWLSTEAISFMVPRVSGGLHQVQVRNPGESTSAVLGLYLDARPEISSVTIGSEHVNSYELLINGRNFQPGSKLLVNGQQIVGTVTGGERERLRYEDCGRLVYERFPYSSSGRELSLQVVNPDGQSSAPARVNAP